MFFGEKPGGASFSGASTNITLYAEVLNRGNPVQRVDFYAFTWSTGANQWIGSVTNPPYRLTWNSRLGDYLLTARAIDAQGITNSSSGNQVSVIASAMPPTIKFISPVNEAQFKAPAHITMVVEAHKELGWVKSVTLEKDYQTLGASGPNAATPDLFFFQATNVSAGYHTFVAKVYDNVGTGMTMFGAPPSDSIHLVVEGETPMSVVSVEAVDNHGSEGGEGVLGNDTITFRFSRTGPTDLPLTVYYSADSKAVGKHGQRGVRPGMYDYDDPIRINPKGRGLGHNSIDIPSGASFADLTLAPLNDDRSDDDVLTIALSNYASSGAKYLEYRPGFPRVAHATITSRPWLTPPSLRLIGPLTNSPPGTFTFEAQPIGWGEWLRSVAFSLDGTGTYPIIAYATNAPYTVVLTNLSPGPHTISASSGNAIARLHFVNPPSQIPLVWIEAAPGYTFEDWGKYGVEAGGFIVYRTGDLASGLDVGYSVSGSAANGIDYQKLSSVVTFPPAESSAKIPIVPIDNHSVNGRRSANVQLLPSGESGEASASAYLLGPKTNATMEIHDNEVSYEFRYRAPSVDVISPLNGTVFGAPANVVIFAEVTGFDIPVHTVEFSDRYEILGIVTNDHPHPPARAWFQFIWTNAPSGEHVLRARAKDRFGATFSAGVNIQVLSHELQTAVAITAPDQYAGESPDSVLDPGRIDISRAGRHDAPLTIYYSISGTASPGVDYVALRGSVTIPAGTNAVSVPINPIDDHLPENAEYVFLALETNAAYRIDSRSVAGVLIKDDEQTLGSQPPLVTMTDPTNGAAFDLFADLMLSANVSSADREIVSVTFFANDRLVGVATNPPYAFLWTNVFPDAYAITARATDNWGITGSSSSIRITVGRPESNQPPSVEIGEPADGAIFNRVPTGMIRATIHDPDSRWGTAELFINDVPVHTKTNSQFNVPYEGIRYDWSDVPPGNYRIKVRATDNWGATGTAESRVTYFRQPVMVNQPQLQTDPASGTARYTIQAYGFPEVTYQWRLNGSDIAGATNAVLDLSPDALNQLAQTVTVVVSNEFGSVMSLPITTSAATPRINQLPTVRLFSPTGGSVFRGVSNIMLHAEAFDDDGITQVGFYANQRLLGMATTPPFSISWSNVIPGGYALSVTATDKAGGTELSKAGTILVLGAEDASEDIRIELNNPVNGAAYPASANIPLWFLIVGRDGNQLLGRERDIVAASFFANDQLLGTCSPPFPPFTPSLIWSNVATGIYSVSVRATDRWGATHYAPVNRIRIADANNKLPPLITRQPQDQTISAGKAGVWFSVDVAGSPPLRFQWRRDETVIPGATGPALELPPLTTNESGGKYSVVVSNEAGFDISKAASLIVLVPDSRPTTGAAVSLNNYDAKKPIVNLDGSLAPAAGTFVQIWGGAVGGPLRLLSSTAGASAYPLSEPGFFDGGFGIVPDIEAGAQAQIQVRAWRGGTNFETASFRGSSLVFKQATGSAQPPPNLPNPAALQIPDTIVLQAAEASQSVHPGTGKPDGNSSMPQILELTYFPISGNWQITIASKTGATFVVQASADLVHWEMLGEFLNPSGILHVLDTYSAGYRHRFYRVSVGSSAQ